MTTSAEHNYIANYEAALVGLKNKPDDKLLQYQAVLSLARAGSLDFAITEYKRYGLDKVKNHEEIMALGGRLSKDQYLRRSGKAALNHARDAAHKYETAFQATGGYFSGVNAATMALMADMPDAVIKDRAKTILDLLPATDDLSSEDKYFTEATRAECQLLLGSSAKSYEDLRAAFDHDPLNYSAHATTLKQFRMITAKQGVDGDWLSDFRTPKAIHYAGHIFGTDKAQEPYLERLHIELSDIIQKQDIGFGYGALAAGSDILIAEALLAEGAELHVILPCDEASFITQSVAPFGQIWMDRYQSCRDQAASVTPLSSAASWPDPVQNRMTGHVAMGQAVLRAQTLAAPTMQLLIWNENSGHSYTATHAGDWAETGREQVIVPYPLKPNGSKPSSQSITDIYEILLLNDEKTEHIKLTAFFQLAHVKDSYREGMAVHLKTNLEEDHQILAALSEAARPYEILISESLASILAFLNEAEFKPVYAGQITSETGAIIRAYTLSIQN